MPPGFLHFEIFIVETLDRKVL
jgi:hypothetical protein